MNNTFGKIIWKNAIIALTHADIVLNEQEAGDCNYEEVLTKFRMAVQNILRKFGVLAHVVSPSYQAPPPPNPLPGTSVDPEYVIYSGYTNWKKSNQATKMATSAAFTDHLHRPEKHWFHSHAAEWCEME